MFTVNAEMDLYDFESMVGFWSGAADRWHDYTEDQKEYLNDVCEGMEFDSLTAVNDFIWFDADELIEDAFGEEEEEEDDEDFDESFTPHSTFLNSFVEESCNKKHTHLYDENDSEDLD